MRKLAVGVVAWLLIGAGSAGAADFKIIHLDGEALKWGPPERGSPATVTYAIADGPQPDPQRINCKHLAGIEPVLQRWDIGRGALRARLREALQAWERVAGITFERAASPADADLVIGAQGVPQGTAYTDVRHTATEVPGRGRITDAAICLNPEAPWETRADGDDETYELGRVLTHEVGHVIGLDHPGGSGPMMAYRYRERVADLRPGDRAGAVWLYGPSDTARLAGRMPGAAHAAAPMVPALPVEAGDRWAIR